MCKVINALLVPDDATFVSYKTESSCAAFLLVWLRSCLFIPEVLSRRSTVVDNTWKELSVDVWLGDNSKEQSLHVPQINLRKHL